MMTRCKRIAGVVLFAMILSIMFVPTDSFARQTTSITSKSNVSDSCKAFLKNVEKDDEFWQDRYGIDISVDELDDDYFIIKEKAKNKLGSTSNGIATVGGKPISFKITEFYAFDKNDKKIKSASNIDSMIITSKKRLTPGGTIKIKRFKNDNNAYGYRIKMEPNGFMDKEFKTACSDVSNLSFYFYFDFIGGLGSDDELILDADDIPDADDSDVDATMKAFKLLDCSKDANLNEFAKAYCHDRKNSVYVKNVKSKTKENAFKCDYKVTKTTPSITSGEYYTESNTKYMRHEKEFKVTSDEPYVYHYTCGTKKNDYPSCKVKCEEVVKVEYGPPVAAIGGLCFEYKVRVTSRVSCGITQPPNPPEPYKGVCTPVPWCNHSGHGAHGNHQGGPSEDFDSCVAECDGGKYSDKCSNKCYQEVYGSSLTKNTSGNEIAYVDKLNTNSQVKATDTAASGSLIYTCRNGKIAWQSGHNGGTRSPNSHSAIATDSRWHKKYWGGGFSSSDYSCYSNTGIMRQCSCSETCFWTPGNCATKYAKYTESYMNKEDGGKADYNNNVKVRKKLLEKCKSYKRCSTKVAYFTIGIDVNGKKYNFPNTNSTTSTEKDKLIYKGASGYTDVQRTDTSKTTTIISSNGCYINANGQKEIEEIPQDWYQAEWTFPGSWISVKTGEVSYLDKSSEPGWVTKKRQFCAPITAKDVNATWWKYYYGVTHGSSDTSVTSSSFVKECLGGNKSQSITNVKKTDVDKESITWNIWASTENFGYFHWDIDMKCFYGISSSLTKKTTEQLTEEQKDKCVVKTGSNYRIRSVDLEHLFPDTKSDTGSRTPGYNWSQYADVSVVSPNSVKPKFGNYKSEASKYAEYVQKKGYSIYSNNNLDYEVVLKPKDLSSLRNKKYGSFNGQTSSKGVDMPVYKSDILRKGTVEVRVRPSVDTLKCNNIAEHGSSGLDFNASCEKDYK